MDSVAEGVPRGKQGLSLLEEMKGNKGQADQNTQCHPLTALSLPLASLHLSDLPLLITKDEKKNLPVLVGIVRGPGDHYRQVCALVLESGCHAETQHMGAQLPFISCS